MTTQFQLFLNFDGNCREALAFYAKLFNSKVEDLQTYAETPAEENYVVPEADKNKVMYASLRIGEMNVMFMDMPSDTPLVVGNNITPTLFLDDKAETVRVFDAMKEGGEVYAELTKTFFSALYGMVKDKFGVIWQILYDAVE